MGDEEVELFIVTRNNVFWKADAMSHYQILEDACISDKKDDFLLSFRFAKVTATKLRSAWSVDVVDDDVPTWWNSDREWAVRRELRQIERIRKGQTQ